ncbi:hypothetical protein ACWPM1_04375 [Tsuneonella sp. HG249]
MTKPNQPEDQSPAQQAGEENGRIKKPQRSEREMVDLARGSEVETRAAASRRS